MSNNTPVRITTVHHDGQFSERPRQEQEPTGTMSELLGAGVARFYGCQHPSKHISTTTYSTVVRCANSNIGEASGKFFNRPSDDRGGIRSAAPEMAVTCVTCPLYTQTPAQSRNIWG